LDHIVKHATANSLKLFVLELFLYAALIVGYYFLVLHFLGPTLKDIYDHQRRLYAGLALTLIIGQGFLLEILTRGLLAWISPRTDDQ
jgi:hypothetical protein